MTRLAFTIAASAALLLSACGANQSDRAMSGAGIGAGAGAVVGAVTGLSLLEGALLGAVAGGLTGYLTDADLINLGDPIWEGRGQPANNAATIRIQAGLAKLGYNPGAVDGIKGKRTTQAIEAYQRDHGLTVDGLASYALANHIDRTLAS
ncbi:MAG: peptidoglycan hydrolase-like protein with peptidoglycan-binding domain [Paracoccaceae bacterium]|jgi:peptidoglycan hydrolase-like protein with peptidoglycan-binding domain